METGQREELQYNHAGIIITDDNQKTEKDPAAAFLKENGECISAAILIREINRKNLTSDS